MAQRQDTVSGTDGKPRCGWASADPLYQKYHDTEWGRPLKDDRALFEFLGNRREKPDDDEASPVTIPRFFPILSGGAASAD